jgi:large subunit ribosomal protein L22
MKATQKYIRTSPRKLRLVADAVRGLSADKALNYLRFMSKRAAEPMYKTLKSAVANAKLSKGLSADKLTVGTIDVAEGPTYKRWRAVSRGMAHSIMKRTSHINITLKEKANGSKS